MRVPGPERRRRGLRPRVALIILAVLAFILLTSMRGIAGFYTDYLWFKGLDRTEVWRGLIWAKLAPAIVFIVVFFAVLLANLIIADRLAPQFRPTTGEEDLVERYRQVVGPYVGRLRVGVSLLLALITGTGVASQWREWLLFRNRVAFGGAGDAQFHKDIGFYVFTLPFLKYVAEWIFAALVILLIVTALAHYLNGGIRPQGPFQRVTPQVKAHLSVILGAMALLKAFSYWLQRFELTFSTRGRGFVGANYTDIHAQLPALRLLIIISVAAAALLLANIFMRGWMLPIIAVGMWAVVSVVIGAVVPAFVQAFRVKPNERSLERPYIKRNLDATKRAFNLADVEVTPFKYAADLDAPKVNAAQDTIGNARLWDPFPFSTLAVYKQIQQIRPFYQFTDVDIDRYNINGAITPTVISPRELDIGQLPNDTWQNRHLVYTHGYGVVASPANRATSNGQPDFVIKDIPPQSAGIDLLQPAIYYGEATNDYALVSTKQEEFDYQNQQGQKNTKCRKCGGVPAAGFGRRLAFWLRFGDVNLVTTKQITADSKILYTRNIRDRIQKLAPFLRFDADPYSAVLDGRVKWIVDAYTTTDRYPYSTFYTQSARNRLEAASGLNTHFNYVRNSVKVVVDAYDGSVDYWIVDNKDPIVRAYAKAFPRLFRDGKNMPASLRAHLRYPEDIFRVQTDTFATYHIDSPDVFYNRSDQWAVSPDPGTGRLAQNLSSTATPTGPTLLNIPQNAERMDPYYLFMRLPGATHGEFVLLEPFVPVSRGDNLGNLLGFMVAKSDPDDYGKISSYRIDAPTPIKGPAQASQDILSTPAISQPLSLLNQNGSEVLQGSLQLIPIGNSLLYVRPYYVQGQTTQKLPELRYVVAYYEGRAVLEDTLQDALAALFQGLPSTPAPNQPSPTGSSSSALLDQAAAALTDADAALKSGDLAAYQRNVNRARDLINQARNGGSSSSTTSSTRPSA